MHIPPVKHQGQTISTAELWQSILINGRANWMCPSSCNHLLWLTSGTSVGGPFHRWRVFWAAWFPCMLASSIEHLQLHQFCRWYAALSLFCIRDHSYFFALVKLCCSRLSDSQEERRAKCFIGGSRGGARGARAPPLFLDETKARGAEKNFLETCHSPPTPRYLIVWIRHCYLPPKLVQYVDRLCCHSSQSLLLKVH